MNLSLVETQTISELADFLYPFLPGNPHPYANKSISFPGIANGFRFRKILASRK